MATDPPSPAEPPGDHDLELIAAASEARTRARAHISRYRVGAAVRTTSGVIYRGCNIEFGNLSNSIHAEEAALSAAVSSGEERIRVIAVVTGEDEPVWPCGMCLQSLHEMGGPDLRVVASNGTVHQEKVMADLLPFAFQLDAEGGQ